MMVPPDKKNRKELRGFIYRTLCDLAANKKSNVVGPQLLTSLPNASINWGLPRRATFATA